MTEDRRTKQRPAKGEDPRQIDRERTTGSAVEETARQDGLVHPQSRRSRMGISSDRPGRDLDDLADAYEPTSLRDRS